MPIFEPLPLPPIENLDPNHFEAFVALRLEVFRQADDAAGGPAQDIGDLAGTDVETATAGDLFTAAEEVDALKGEVAAPDVVGAAALGDALVTEIDAQLLEPPPHAGPEDGQTPAPGATRVRQLNLDGLIAGLGDVVSRISSLRP